MLTDLKPLSRNAPRRLRLVVAPIALDRSDLVARAREGDRWAQHDLYEQHAEYLTGMCTRLLRNRQDALDVVQDAFVVAFTKIGTLKDDGAFRAWIAQIAVRAARRRMRRGTLFKLFGFGDERDELSLPELARTDATAEARSELAAIDRVLVRVSHEHRTAWILRHIDGEQLEDIAAACEVSIATAKRRIADVDAKIRRALGECS